MEEIGFRSDGNGFVNNMEDKYLKVVRTDFDLAYRNFLGSLNQ